MLGQVDFNRINDLRQAFRLFIAGGRALAVGSRRQR
jgi:hypothetical protein